MKCIDERRTYNTLASLEICRVAQARLDQERERRARESRRHTEEAQKNTSVGDESVVSTIPQLTGTRSQQKDSDIPLDTSKELNSNIASASRTAVGTLAVREDSDEECLHVVESGDFDA